jgi:hypothetical protein
MLVPVRIYFKYWHDVTVHRHICTHKPSK